MSSINDREISRAVTEGLLEVDYEKSTGMWQRRLRNRRFAAKWALIISFVIIISASFYFSELRKSDIAKTWNIVKPGDKIYVQDLFLTDTVDIAFRFARKVRPITLKDIGAMNISLAQKRKMVAQLDTTLKKAIMEESSKIAIPRSNMFKYGTACIGVFLDRDSTTSISDGGNDDKWYMVRPNRLVTENGYVFYLPKGYVLANNNYYIDPQDIQLTEPGAIKRYKPHPFVSSAKPSHSGLKQTVSPVKHHKKRKKKKKQVPVQQVESITQDSL